MIQVKIEYWDRISQFTSRSEVKRVETLSAKTEDELFEKFYKKNNSLRYCNGSYFKFAEISKEKEYKDWENSLSHSRSFNLYYGNGVVD